MRIVDFVIHHVRIPLKKEVRHASHVRTSTDSLVVCCHLDDGSRGWGEGLPRAYVTGETIEQAWDMLPDLKWKSTLGSSMTSLADAIAMLSEFRLPSSLIDERGCLGNSLRCAVELSVLDAVCRSLNVPLSAVTEAVPETAAIRQSLPEVRYGAAITAATPWKQRWRALLMRLSGFEQIKVKVGVTGVDDVALLRRVRNIVGSNVDLRIDANEAWQCETLPRCVAPLLPFGITALEQPVPHEDVGGLAPLRGQIGVPLMLDESLCCEFDAHRAIAEGLCDLFNLRLSKCGGFLPTLQLAALAHHAGLGYQLGCQVGETGILSAAGRHFATSVAGIRYLEGSYDRHLVHERLTIKDLTFGLGGRAPALHGPGLGITIDHQALQRVTIQSATFAL
ncbi:dipeptide epimerase [bacterium]|nr:dipeptide epimerase [bacterium]